MAGMQTFAHGRDGGRTMELKDMTLTPEGRAAVFVGSGTHPSYADEFVGRNKFMDIVGSKYKITPDKFIDLHAQKSFKNKSPEERSILPKWSGFKRMGECSPMLKDQSTICRDHVEYLDKGKTWNRYKPSKFITKTLKKAKDAILGLFGKKKPKAGKPVASQLPPMSVNSIEDIQSRERSLSVSKAIPKAKDKTRKRANSMPSKPKANWKERNEDIRAKSEKSSSRGKT